MLPEPIYEALPYLYLAGGIGAFFGIDIMPGQVSGLMLAFAGLLIWRMRKRYRAAF